MAAVAPLIFYMLLFFPLVKGRPSPLSDDTSTTDGIVHLTTLDGDLFDVNQAILYDSVLIKQEIYNGRVGSNINIKLQNTTSRALGKLIHYVQYSNRTEFVVSEWEEDLRENWQELFEILTAANELRMESVSDMAAGIIGGMMIGKSPFEISRMFNCENEIIDLTGAEQWTLPPFGEPMEEVPMGELVPIN